MQNQLPNKQDLIKALEQSNQSLKEITVIISEARAKQDFSGVAALYNIKLGLENVVYQIETQIKQLEALEQKVNDNNQPSKN